jgi:hypothetical protein
MSQDGPFYQHGTTSAGTSKYSNWKANPAYWCKQESSAAGDPYPSGWDNVCRWKGEAFAPWSPAADTVLFGSHQYHFGNPTQLAEVSGWEAVLFCKWTYWDQTQHGDDPPSPPEGCELSSRMTVASLAPESIYDRLLRRPGEAKHRLVREALMHAALGISPALDPTDRQGRPPEFDTWIDWLHEMFPRHLRAGFSPRHEDFWQHVWSIEAGEFSRPFAGIWPREGGKSTSAELACSALGARGARKYAVDVRAVQDKADDSVTNIASLLESPAMSIAYPGNSELPR